MQRRGRGEETPHQPSDLFKRGPSKPHCPKGKQGLAFQKTPEISLAWETELKVAAKLPGPSSPLPETGKPLGGGRRSPPASARLLPRERENWRRAGAPQSCATKSARAPPRQAPLPIVLRSPRPPAAVSSKPAPAAPPPTPPEPWASPRREGSQPRLHFGRRSATAAKFEAAIKLVAAPVAGRALSWPRGLAAGGDL